MHFGETLKDKIQLLAAPIRYDLVKSQDSMEELRKSRLPIQLFEGDDLKDQGQQCTDRVEI